MNSFWDYNEEELKKTNSGRTKILERKINYGTKKGEKISREEVKQNWHNLELFPLQKRLFELLIWGRK